MRLSFSFCLLLTFSISYAQVNYEEIKKKVSDSLGSYYYPSLVDRFRGSDSTFTPDDFDALYFGGIFLTSYNPEKISEVETAIREANFSHEYLRAYELADSLLTAYPVSIQAYFEKAFACYNLKRFEEETYNKKRYKVLIRTIITNGDGKSISSAWYANLPNDEFEIIKYLQAEIKDEAELESNDQTFDLFTLKPNKSKMKHVFFNVTKQRR